MHLLIASQILLLCRLPAIAASIPDLLFKMQIDDTPAFRRLARFHVVDTACNARTVRAASRPWWSITLSIASSTLLGLGAGHHLHSHLGGLAYLAVVIDLYPRRVVGW